MGKSWQKPKKQDLKGSYRISELVEASGVSRDMIKYYLRAGLLPKPKKPRSNLSLYTEQHLQLIRLVLRFQEETKLSLPEIAAVFKQAGHDPHTIELELLSDKYRIGSARDNIIPFNTSDRAGVSLAFPAGFIEELVESELLAGDGELDENREKIAGLLWALKQEGIPFDFFRKARKLLKELADLEVKTLLGTRLPDLDYEAAAERVMNHDRMINRWMISEKTEQARNLYQRVIENSEQALTTIHDTIYIPSQVFRRRFNVDAEIESLGRELNRDPENLEKLQHLSGACLLLTDYDRSIAFADAALEVAPDDDISVAFKSLSYGMDRNLEKSVMYAKRLEASGRLHPIPMEARLLSLLMQAARLGGVADTNHLLKKAVELFLETPAMELETDFDQLEAWLLQGRANTLFPDAINRRSEAIANLETMLAMLDKRSFEELGLPLEALRVIYQVYANFYLGLMYEAEGDKEKATSCFEQVIKLDPSSNFGEIAYLKLA